MIADSMVSLVKNSSVIRAMFEEGNRLAKLYGAENVYDFSLGNPNVPAPAEVNEAVKDSFGRHNIAVAHLIDTVIHVLDRVDFIFLTVLADHTQRTGVGVGFKATGIADKSG